MIPVADHLPTVGAHLTPTLTKLCSGLVHLPNRTVAATQATERTQAEFKAELGSVNARATAEANQLKAEVAGLEKTIKEAASRKRTLVERYFMGDVDDEEVQLVKDIEKMVEGAFKLNRMPELSLELTL